MYMIGGGSLSQVYDYCSRQVSRLMSYNDSILSGFDSGLRCAMARGRHLCLGHQANGIPKRSVSCDAHME